MLYFHNQKNHNLKSKIIHVYICKPDIHTDLYKSYAQQKTNTQTNKQNPGKKETRMLTIVTLIGKIQ